MARSKQKPYMALWLANLVRDVVVGSSCSSMLATPSSAPPSTHIWLRGGQYGPPSLTLKIACKI
jgi:hypothetical protein